MQLVIFVLAVAAPLLLIAAGCSAPTPPLPPTPQAAAATQVLPPAPTPVPATATSAPATATAQPATATAVPRTPTAAATATRASSATSTPAATVGPFPLGTYTTTTYPTGIPARIILITMTFEASGKWLITAQDLSPTPIPESPAGGTFTVSGDEFRVRDDPNLGGTCAKLGYPEGIYKWHFDGQILTFDVVDDKCQPRRADFSIIVLQKAR